MQLNQVLNKTFLILLHASFVLTHLFLHFRSARGYPFPGTWTVHVRITFVAVCLSHKMTSRVMLGRQCHVSR